MLPDTPRIKMSVPPAVHGGLNYSELQGLGLPLDKVIDFSTNVNPYGPSPAVRAALAGIPLDRYPDREALALRTALAEMLGTSVSRIVVGNGASELIWLTALAFVKAGDNVLVLGPTYSEYERAARITGGSIVSWNAREEDAFAPHIEAVGETLHRLRPDSVFLCNPNNPTGTVIPAEVIGGWARQFPGTLFVVDEAYRAFALGLRSCLEQRADNVLVLCSLTKDVGLAGLRLGYAVGPDELVERLRCVQPPWSVNALAQAAGVAALREPGYLARSLERIREDAEQLRSGLTRLGLAPLPSAVSFFLLRVGDGAEFRRALLARGILVRDCASFGLPEYVRIASRRTGENERLLAALREVR